MTYQPFLLRLHPRNRLQQPSILTLRHIAGREQLSVRVNWL
jgi:hypothetical protein